MTGIEKATKNLLLFCIREYRKEIKWWAKKKKDTNWYRSIKDQKEGWFERPKYNGEELARMVIEGDKDIFKDENIQVLLKEWAKDKLDDVLYEIEEWLGRKILEEEDFWEFVEEQIADEYRKNREKYDEMLWKGLS